MIHDTDKDQVLTDGASCTCRVGKTARGGRRRLVTFRSRQQARGVPYRTGHLYKHSTRTSDPPKDTRTAAPPAPSPADCQGTRTVLGTKDHRHEHDMTPAPAILWQQWEGRHGSQKRDTTEMYSVLCTST
ncbi:hypothetical protein J3E69DRAFT_336697 [Trichoderma sp. SZMC 28015]